MDKKIFNSGGVVERANNRLMRDGIKDSGSTSARHCYSGSVSVSMRYRGESISQTISRDNITKAFEKSVKSVSNAKKL